MYNHQHPLTMKIWKYVVIPLMVLLAISAAWYSGYKSSLFQKKAEESSTVLLNRIEKVMKLVTVEGHISEVYSYKDHVTFDFSPFRKKALIRVNAKASIGYDFEKVVFDIDESTKTITINDFPEPEVLSIDHDLDYYDISQGTFNTFTNEDYNKINKRAKDYVKTLANEGDLIDSAKEQKEELISTLQLLLNGLGWKLVLKEKPFLG